MSKPKIDLKQVHEDVARLQKEFVELDCRVQECFQKTFGRPRSSGDDDCARDYLIGIIGCIADQAAINQMKE